MGDDSRLRGRGFKSLRRILDGHDFSHWFVVKSVLFVAKINEKEWHSIRLTFRLPRCSLHYNKKNPKRLKTFQTFPPFFAILSSLEKILSWNWLFLLFFATCGLAESATSSGCFLHSSGREFNYPVIFTFKLSCTVMENFSSRRWTTILPSW